MAKNKSKATAKTKSKASAKTSSLNINQLFAQAQRASNPRSLADFDLGVNPEACAQNAFGYVNHYYHHVHAPVSVAQADDLSDAPDAHDSWRGQASTQIAAEQQAVVAETPETAPATAEVVEATQTAQTSQTAQTPETTNPQSAEAATAQTSRAKAPQSANVQLEANQNPSATPTDAQANHQPRFKFKALAAAAALAGMGISGATVGHDFGNSLTLPQVSNFSLLTQAQQVGAESTRQEKSAAASTTKQNPDTAHLAQEDAGSQTKPVNGGKQAHSAKPTTSADAANPAEPVEVFKLPKPVQQPDVATISLPTYSDFAYQTQVSNKVEQVAQEYQDTVKAQVDDVTTNLPVAKLALATQLRLPQSGTALALAQLQDWFVNVEAVHQVLKSDQQALEPYADFLAKWNNLAVLSQAQLKQLVKQALALPRNQILRYLKPTTNGAAALLLADLLTDTDGLHVWRVEEQLENFLKPVLAQLRANKDLTQVGKLLQESGFAAWFKQADKQELVKRLELNLLPKLLPELATAYQDKLRALNSQLVDLMQVSPDANPAAAQATTHSSQNHPTNSSPAESNHSAVQGLSSQHQSANVESITEKNYHQHSHAQNADSLSYYHELTQAQNTTSGLDQDSISLAGEDGYRDQVDTEGLERLGSKGAIVASTQSPDALDPNNFSLETLLGYQVYGSLVAQEKIARDQAPTSLIQAALLGQWASQLAGKDLAQLTNADLGKLLEQLVSEWAQGKADYFGAEGSLVLGKPTKSSFKLESVTKAKQLDWQSLQANQDLVTLKPLSQPLSPQAISAQSAESAQAALSVQASQSLSANPLTTESQPAAAEEVQPTAAAENSAPAESTTEQETTSAVSPLLTQVEDPTDDSQTWSVLLPLYLALNAEGTLSPQAQLHLKQGLVKAGVLADYFRTLASSMQKAPKLDVSTLVARNVQQQVLSKLVELWREDSKIDLSDFIVTEQVLSDARDQDGKSLGPVVTRAKNPADYQAEYLAQQAKYFSYQGQVIDAPSAQLLAKHAGSSCAQNLRQLDYRYTQHLNALKVPVGKVTVGNQNTLDYSQGLAGETFNGWELLKEFSYLTYLLHDGGQQSFALVDGTASAEPATVVSVETENQLAENQTTSTQPAVDPTVVEFEAVVRKFTKEQDLANKVFSRTKSALDSLANTSDTSTTNAHQTPRAELYRLQELGRSIGKEETDYDQAIDEGQQPAITPEEFFADDNEAHSESTQDQPAVNQESTSAASADDPTDAEERNFLEQQNNQGEAVEQPAKQTLEKSANQAVAQAAEQASNQVDAKPAIDLDSFYQSVTKHRAAQRKAGKRPALTDLPWQSVSPDSPLFSEFGYPVDLKKLEAKAKQIFINDLLELEVPQAWIQAWLSNDKVTIAGETKWQQDTRNYWLNYGRSLIQAGLDQFTKDYVKNTLAYLNELGESYIDAQLAPLDPVADGHSPVFLSPQERIALLGYDNTGVSYQGQKDTQGNLTGKSSSFASDEANHAGNADYASASENQTTPTALDANGSGADSDQHQPAVPAYATRGFNFIAHLREKFALGVSFANDDLILPLDYLFNYQSRDYRLRETAQQVQQSVEEAAEVWTKRYFNNTRFLIRLAVQTSVEQRPFTPALPDKLKEHVATFSNDKLLRVGFEATPWLFGGEEGAEVGLRKSLGIPADFFYFTKYGDPSKASLAAVRSRYDQVRAALIDYLLRVVNFEQDWRAEEWFIQWPAKLEQLKNDEFFALFDPSPNSEQALVSAREQVFKDPEVAQYLRRLVTQAVTESFSPSPEDVAHECPEPVQNVVTKAQQTQQPAQQQTQQQAQQQTQQQTQHKVVKKDLSQTAQAEQAQAVEPAEAAVQHAADANKSTTAKDSHTSLAQTTPDKSATAQAKTKQPLVYDPAKQASVLDWALQAYPVRTQFYYPDSALATTDFNLLPVFTNGQFGSWWRLGLQASDYYARQSQFVLEPKVRTLDFAHHYPAQEVLGYRQPEKTAALSYLGYPTTNNPALNRFLSTSAKIRYINQLYDFLAHDESVGNNLLGLSQSASPVAAQAWAALGQEPYWEAEFNLVEPLLREFVWAYAQLLDRAGDGVTWPEKQQQGEVAVWADLLKQANVAGLDEKANTTAQTNTSSDSKANNPTSSADAPASAPARAESAKDSAASSSKLEWTDERREKAWDNAYYHLVETYRAKISKARENLHYRYFSQAPGFGVYQAPASNKVEDVFGTLATVDQLFADNQAKQIPLTQSLTSILGYYKQYVQRRNQLLLAELVAQADIFDAPQLAIFKDLVQNKLAIDVNTDYLDLFNSAVDFSIKPTVTTEVVDYQEVNGQVRAITTQHEKPATATDRLLKLGAALNLDHLWHAPAANAYLDPLVTTGVSYQIVGYNPEAKQVTVEVTQEQGRNETNDEETRRLAVEQAQQELDQRRFVYGYGEEDGDISYLAYNHYYQLPTYQQTLATGIGKLSPLDKAALLLKYQDHFSALDQATPSSGALNQTNFTQEGSLGSQLCEYKGPGTGGAGGAGNVVPEAAAEAPANPLFSSAANIGSAANSPQVKQPADDNAQADESTAAKSALSVTTSLRDAQFGQLCGGSDLPEAKVIGYSTKDKIELARDFAENISLKGKMAPESRDLNQLAKEAAAYYSNRNNLPHEVPVSYQPEVQGYFGKLELVKPFKPVQKLYFNYVLDNQAQVPAQTGQAKKPQPTSVGGAQASAPAASQQDDLTVGQILDLFTAHGFNLALKAQQVKAQAQALAALEQNSLAAKKQQEQLKAAQKITNLAAALRRARGGKVSTALAQAKPVEEPKAHAPIGDLSQLPSLQPAADAEYPEVAEPTQTAQTAQTAPQAETAQAAKQVSSDTKAAVKASGSAQAQTTAQAQTDKSEPTSSPTAQIPETANTAAPAQAKVDPVKTSLDIDDTAKAALATANALIKQHLADLTSEQAQEIIESQQVKVTPDGQNQADKDDFYEQSGDFAVALVDEVAAFPGKLLSWFDVVTPEYRKDAGLRNRLAQALFKAHIAQGATNANEQLEAKAYTQAYSSDLTLGQAQPNFYNLGYGIYPAQGVGAAVVQQWVSRDLAQAKANGYPYFTQRYDLKNFTYGDLTRLLSQDSSIAQMLQFGESNDDYLKLSQRQNNADYKQLKAIAGVQMALNPWQLVSGLTIKPDFNQPGVLADGSHPDADPTKVYLPRYRKSEQTCADERAQYQHLTDLRTQLVQKTQQALLERQSQKDLLHLQIQRTYDQLDQIEVEVANAVTELSQGYEQINRGFRQLLEEIAGFDYESAQKLTVEFNQLLQAQEKAQADAQADAQTQPHAQADAQTPPAAQAQENPSQAEQPEQPTPADADPVHKLASDSPTPALARYEQGRSYFLQLLARTKDWLTTEYKGLKQAKTLQQAQQESAAEQELAKLKAELRQAQADYAQVYQELAQAQAKLSQQAKALAEKALQARTQPEAQEQAQAETLDKLAEQALAQLDAQAQTSLRTRLETAAGKVQALLAQVAAKANQSKSSAAGLGSNQLQQQNLDKVQASLADLEEQVEKLDASELVKAEQALASVNEKFAALNQAYTELEESPAPSFDLPSDLADLERKFQYSACNALNPQFYTVGVSNLLDYVSANGLRNLPFGYFAEFTSYAAIGDLDFAIVDGGIVFTYPTVESSTTFFRHPTTNTDQVRFPLSSQEFTLKPQALSLFLPWSQLDGIVRPEFIPAWYKADKANKTHLSLH